MGLFGSPKAAKAKDGSDLTVTWELVAGTSHLWGGNIKRAKVPGGWFVSLIDPGAVHCTGIAFYPDPAHEWNENLTK
jgi:hypothetical protein